MHIIKSATDQRSEYEFNNDDLYAYQAHARLGYFKQKHTPGMLYQEYSLL